MATIDYQYSEEEYAEFCRRARRAGLPESAHQPAFDSLKKLHAAGYGRTVGDHIEFAKTKIRQTSAERYCFDNAGERPPKFTGVSHRVEYVVKR